MLCGSYMTCAFAVAATIPRALLFMSTNKTKQTCTNKTKQTCINKRRRTGVFSRGLISEEALYIVWVPCMVCASFLFVLKNKKSQSRAKTYVCQHTKKKPCMRPRSFKSNAKSPTRKHQNPKPNEKTQTSSPMSQAQCYPSVAEIRANLKQMQLQLRLSNLQKLKWIRCKNVKTTKTKPHNETHQKSNAKSTTPKK